MDLKKVIKLIELTRTLDFDEQPLLHGRKAMQFGPGDKKDEDRESHDVNYDSKKRVFYYHSYCVSGHNGDYYNTFYKELKPTKQLLKAIVEEITPRAVEAAEAEARKELNRSIRRSAEKRVKKILQDI